MPLSTPAMSSAVFGQPAADSSDTLVIRCSGMCPGESANAQPFDRPKFFSRAIRRSSLVADEHAVLDQVPGMARHALVVVADGGRPCGDVPLPVAVVLP